MIAIGLTGSVGSGKTTVGRMLARLGAVVIDADRLVREMQAPGSRLLAQMRRVLGPWIIGPGGELNRALVAERVFGDPELLRRLNALVHPAVRRREAALLALFRDHPIVVLDIPLLFENNLHRLLDWVVVVTASEQVRIARLHEQRGLSRDQIRQRMMAQWPPEIKSRLGHFIIRNSGSIEATEQQVRALWARLRRISAATQHRSKDWNPFYSISQERRLYHETSKKVRTRGRRSR